MDEELFLSPLIPRNSRSLDPRGKIILLFLFAPLTFLRPLPLQGLDFLLLLGGLWFSKMNPVRFLWKSRGVLVLLLFFLVMHGLNRAADGGTENLIFRLFQEIPGAVSRITPLWLVYTAGILFIRTTGHSEIRQGLTYLFLPFPGALSERIGTALGLTFTMIPLLMGEFRKIREAQRSRGGDIIKNPFRRITLPLFPLLVNSLIHSRRLAEAMEARAWDTKSPGKTFLDRQKHHYLHKTWTLRDSLFFLFPVFYLFLSLFLANRL
jgi:energy-coupling factor transport system permease protein